MKWSPTPYGIVLLPSIAIPPQLPLHVTDTPCSSPGYCLGGQPEIQPLGTYYPTPATVDLTANYENILKLARDFTYAELSGASTISYYRGIFVGWASADSSTGGGEMSTGMYLKLTQPSDSNITVQAYVPATFDTMERIANELTAPSGFSGSAYTTETLVHAAYLSTTGCIPVWFKITLAAGATSPTYWDEFKIHLSNPALPAADHVEYIARVPISVYGGLSFGTPTKPAANKLIGVGQKVQHTITVVNSSGTLTDPPNSRVLCTVYGPNEGTDPNRQPRYVELTYCIKTATGTYLHEFIPEKPGYYTLHFRTPEDAVTNLVYVSAHTGGEI